MNKLTLFILFCIGLSITVSAKDQPLKPFAYGEVTLKDSYFKTMVDAEKEFFLSIPNDDLLKGFRQRAGLNAPGKGLDGWYGKDIFHVFGQLVAGYSRLYAATGDERCRKKAIYLVREWGNTIDPDGYFYYSNQPNAVHYVYEKMMGGLVDCYVYCKYPEAAKLMSAITSWAIKNLDRNREYGQHIDKFNGEWYTLSENLFRAYDATKDQKYLDFAHVWENTEFWDIVRQGKSPFPKRDFYHAYSHLNTFCSAAAAYNTTSDKLYLETAIAGYDFFRNTQCFATGGFGPDERLMTKEELVKLLASTVNSFEVQCSTWACFKLCKNLISFTGTARYGDWMELLLINGIGANIPIRSDGKNYHYASYNPSEALKINHSEGWWCCTGTRPQAFADIQNIIWFHDNTNLYMNQFVPSEVTWNGLKVTQQGSFPQSNKIEISFAGEMHDKFCFNFRLPEWLTNTPIVKINGHKVKITTKDGWGGITRQWSNGDQISVELPMGFKNISFMDNQKYPLAINYGPVTMAAQGKATTKLWEIADAQKTAIAGNPLVFKVSNDPNITLRPYYTIPENEPYHIYFDPNTTIRVSERHIVRKGEWGSGITNHCKQTGGYIEVTFTGTGIRWQGFKYDDAGIAEVTINGQTTDLTDQYHPQRGEAFSWVKSGLPQGTHTLRLTVTGKNNPSSSDYWLNYSHFEVIE